jgi:hypothetical protein
MWARTIASVDSRRRSRILRLRREIGAGTSLLLGCVPGRSG